MLKQQEKILQGFYSQGQADTIAPSECCHFVNGLLDKMMLPVIPVPLTVGQISRDHMLQYALKKPNPHKC